ncbi:MAG: hypothetical protein ACXWNX_15785 [Isosphaeraceae bacterium]
MRARPAGASRGKACAQRNGHACMPGQVPEPGRFAAAEVGAWKQHRGPGPLHHSLNHLRQGPGGCAARQEPARQLAVPGQRCRAGRRGGGA